MLQRRTAPICSVPEMLWGSQPIDGGHLLLTDVEKINLLAQEPNAAPWIRPYLGAEEFLHSIPRWCLWLKDCSPSAMAVLPQVRARVQQVKAMRLASNSAPTNKLASYPTFFGNERHTDAPYLLMPIVSSEKRNYVPIGFISNGAVASNLVFMLPKATLIHFAILTSTMHMTWMRYVCGRLKSDFRYSNTIVYNNFPWPNIVNSLTKSASNVPVAFVKYRQTAPENIAKSKTNAITA